MSLTEESRTTLEHAESLSAQGFFPIAIWGVVRNQEGRIVCQCGKNPCPGIGKHPIGNSWQTQDREEALARIKGNPGCNIGCLTGSKSGLLVLDMDVGEGKQGPQSLTALQAQHGDLPRTATVETGSGGRHYYFKIPEGLNLGNSSGKLGPGLDTRAENGQGVLPPSIHKSGNRYQWISDLHPDSTPIAELPAAWLGLLTSEAPRSPVPDTLPTEASPETLAKLAALGMTQERAVELAEAYIEEVPGAVSGDYGNASTYALACRLIGLLYTYDDAWSLLLQWNDSCDPPWNGTAQHGPESLVRLFRSALSEKCQEEGNPWALKRLEDALDRAPILAKPFPEDRSGSTTGPESVPSAPRFSAMRGFSVAELQGELPPVEWIWKGMIPLDPGMAGSLVGAGAIGKSSLSVGLAVARALGQPFLELPTKPGRTVIITKEESRVNVQRKLKAWTTGLTFSQLQAVEENVIVLSLQGEALTLVTQDRHGVASPHPIEIAALAEAINLYRPELIMIETLNRFVTAETNEGMSAIISALEMLGKKCNATTLIHHHPSKAEAKARGQGDAQSGRGGGALSDNGRFSIDLAVASKKEIDKLGIEVEPDSLYVLASTKLNVGVKAAPIHLMEGDSNPWARTFVKCDLSADLPANRRTTMAHDLARVVREHGPMTVRDMEKSCKEHGIPRAQVKAIAGYAKSVGLLISQGQTTRGTEKLAHNPAMPLQPFSQAEIDRMDADQVLKAFPENTSHTAGSALLNVGGA